MNKQPTVIIILLPMFSSLIESEHRKTITFSITTLLGSWGTYNKSNGNGDNYGHDGDNDEHLSTIHKSSQLNANLQLKSCYRTNSMYLCYIIQYTYTIVIRRPSHTPCNTCREEQRRQNRTEENKWLKEQAIILFYHCQFCSRGAEKNRKGHLWKRATACIIFVKYVCICGEAHYILCAEVLQDIPCSAAAERRQRRQIIKIVYDDRPTVSECTVARGW